MRARIWWMLLLRGLVGIALGVMLIAWPKESAEAIVMLIGFFALLTGAIVLAHALAARFMVWPHSVVGGGITVVLGLIALLAPGAVATIMVYVVGAWALLVGIIELVSASALQRMNVDESFARGMGIVSVLFGILIIVRPGAGIAAAALLIGIYFFATGGMQLWQAMRIRSAPGPNPRHGS